MFTISRSCQVLDATVADSCLTIFIDLIIIHMHDHNTMSENMWRMSHCTRRTWTKIMINQYWQGKVTDCTHFSLTYRSLLIIQFLERVWNKVWKPNNDGSKTKTFIIHYLCPKLKVNRSDRKNNFEGSRNGYINVYKKNQYRMRYRQASISYRT